MRLFKTPNGLIRQSDAGTLLGVAPFEIKPVTFRLAGRGRTSLLTAPFALTRFDREMPTADSTLKAMEGKHTWLQALVPVGQSPPANQLLKVQTTAGFYSFVLNWLLDPNVADLQPDNILLGTSGFGTVLSQGMTTTVNASDAYRYWVNTLRQYVPGKQVFTYESGSQVLTKNAMVALGGNAGFPYTHNERTFRFDSGSSRPSSWGLSIASSTITPTEITFVTNGPHLLNIGNTVNIRDHQVTLAGGVVNWNQNGTDPATGNPAPTITRVGTSPPPWPSGLEGWYVYLNGVGKRFKVIRVSGIVLIVETLGLVTSYVGTPCTLFHPSFGVLDRDYTVTAVSSPTSFKVANPTTLPAGVAGSKGTFFPSGTIAAATAVAGNTQTMITFPTDPLMPTVPTVNVAQFQVGDFFQVNVPLSSMIPGQVPANQLGRQVWKVVSVSNTGIGSITIDRPSQTWISPLTGTTQWKRSCCLGFSKDSSTGIANDRTMDFRCPEAKTLFMGDLLRAVRYHATFGVDGVLLDDNAHHSLSAPGNIEDWTTVTAPRLRDFRQTLGKELRMRLGANLTWQYCDEDYTASGAPQLEALLGALDAVWMEGGYNFFKRRNYADIPKYDPPGYRGKSFNKWYFETLTYLLNRGLTMMFVSFRDDAVLFNKAITVTTVDPAGSNVVFDAKGHELRVGDQVGIYGHGIVEMNRVAEVTVAVPDASFTVNFTYPSKVTGGAAMLAYSRLHRTIGVTGTGTDVAGNLTFFTTGNNVYTNSGKIAPPTLPDTVDNNHYVINPYNARNSPTTGYPQFSAASRVYGYWDNVQSKGFDPTTTYQVAYDPDVTAKDPLPPNAPVSSAKLAYGFTVGTPANSSGILIDLDSDKRQFAALFMVLRNPGHRGFVDWATNVNHTDEQWQSWPINAVPTSVFVATYDNIDGTGGENGHCITVVKTFKVSDGQGGSTNKTAILYPQKTWGNLQ